MTGTDSSPVCADCAQHVERLHVVRKRNLCTPCFTRYIDSKILKRMESYRMKISNSHERKRLFLPVSGGVSSLVLLSVLDAQLQKQMSKQGRTAYDLVVGHIDLTVPHATSTAHSIVDPQWYQELTKRYPALSFQPAVNITDVFQIDSTLANDITTCLNVSLPTDINSNATTYNSLLNACTTATTLNDIQQIILHRFIGALAKRHDCGAIIYGHSDSRLAALALADVAKGRGGAVPGDIADGFNPVLEMRVNYPARDLFKAELELYVQLQDTGLVEMLAPGEQKVIGGDGAVDGKTTGKGVVSVKSMSIDELLTGYITREGEKYPSIMANVVRTVGKLQASEGEEARYCRLCRGLILTSPANAVGGGEGGQELCYGCVRMKQEIKVRSPP